MNTQTGWKQEGGAKYELMAWGSLGLQCANHTLQGTCGVPVWVRCFPSYLAEHQWHNPRCSPRLPGPLLTFEATARTWTSWSFKKKFLFFCKFHKVTCSKEKNKMGKKEEKSKMIASWDRQGQICMDSFKPCEQFSQNLLSSGLFVTHHRLSDTSLGDVPGPLHSSSTPSLAHVSQS